MELENGGGHLRGDGAEESLSHDLGLALAGDDHDHALGMHDVADAHGVGEAGHILFLLKEALVGLNGGVGQGDLVGALGEVVVRLIEADVSVGAETQQLQIDAAQGADDLVIAAALFLGVGIHAAGHIGVGQINVDVVKEVVAHKVNVALIAGVVQPHILVQVDALDAAEIDVTLFVPFDQLLVGADGTGTGGQTQYAVGLQNDLSRDDVGGLTTHMVVVTGRDDPHFNILLSESVRRCADRR